MHEPTSISRRRPVLLLILLLVGDERAAFALEGHESGLHPMAVDHPPLFITSPGETDILLVVMAVVLVGAVLAVGVLFFWLHSLPERLVHNSTKVHFDIVAALGLLSLFTHIHLFWVAALLIALVRIPIPDFSGLLGRIAGSLEKMAASAPADMEGPSPGRLNIASPYENEPLPLSSPGRKLPREHPISDRTARPKPRPLDRLFQALWARHG